MQACEFLEIKLKMCAPSLGSHRWWLHSYPSMNAMACHHSSYQWTSSRVQCSQHWCLMALKMQLTWKQMVAVLEDHQCNCRMCRSWSNCGAKTLFVRVRASYEKSRNLQKSNQLRTYLRHQVLLNQRAWENLLYILSCHWEVHKINFKQCVNALASLPQEKHICHATLLLHEFVNTGLKSWPAVQKIHSTNELKINVLQA